MSFDVVILAAGQGSRMRSRLPKVLHTLAGRSMLQRIIDSAKQLSDVTLHVVVGHGADQIEAALAGQPNIHFVYQQQQLGTGHAVAQALPALGDGPVLILTGDTPLLTSATLEQLSAGLAQDQLTLLSVVHEDPSGYGRIVRDDSGQVTAIVEQKDASEQQRLIRECNTGLMGTTGALLKRWLPALSANNAQGEYYLTDIVGMAYAEGVPLDAVQAGCVEEVSGVNDRRQLAALERWLQRQQAEQAMAQGASLADPARFDQRGTLTLGRDVTIDVGCIFEGDVTLEDGVSVGPYCVIRDAHIGADTHIEAYSHIDGASAAGNNQIGPYARLRPGSTLAAEAKVGNFVEIKKATLDHGTKVNHLSYIGDAHIGQHTNVGAGTITCNYDGVNKHHTEIGSNVFVGSNTALVAPITIGDRVTIAAGSTLTDSVEQGLAFGRARQTVKENWRRAEQDDER
ncbi:bifunctional UDP-N-acetylglucosamine diphosphorylase/glucosamine-1-phosphate N-acetyltransferase GlmU [Carnimonas bestiolae]|uniref:bifunctional UDP-N-acetylglucosamine diphosphorylase/glucosamine-1-phosphate N-acetyltransferase GlmU n=1 Tax=Carnimonas bestiolae TaxID=3402172 RepID=UPI003EDCA2AD